jgi:hypothetical protein
LKFGEETKGEAVNSAAFPLASGSLLLQDLGNLSSAALHDALIGFMVGPICPIFSFDFGRGRLVENCLNAFDERYTFLVRFVSTNVSLAKKGHFLCAVRLLASPDFLISVLIENSRKLSAGTSIEFVHYQSHRALPKNGELTFTTAAPKGA